MKQMARKYIIIYIFFINTLSIFATPQRADILLYNGEKYRLIVNPMERYFNQYPYKRPEAITSGLWRGYFASFEIINNELWVIDIYKETHEIINDRYILEYISIINEILDGNNKMKIDWFNSLLIITHGNRIGYPQGGYGTTFEYYKILEFKKGVLQSELNMNLAEYEEYQEELYQKIKKTNIYKTQYEKNKESNIFGIQEFYAFLSTEDIKNGVFINKRMILFIIAIALCIVLISIFYKKIIWRK